MALKGKRLLLIGAARLIDLHAFDELIKKDVVGIRVFENIKRGSEENLADALKKSLVNIFSLGGELMRLDILDAAMKYCYSDILS
jgi:hypothetical protein